MPKILFTLVGGNPASSLVSARVVKPERMVLICTSKTEDKARTLTSQVGCHADVALLEAGLPVPVFADRLAEQVCVKPGWDVVADVTGGTTDMRFGLHHFLQRLDQACQLVYLGQGSYRLRDLMTGEMLHDEPVEIRPQEILAWHRAEKRKVVWHGRLSQIPKEYRERANLGSALVVALAQERYRRPNKDELKNKKDDETNYIYIDISCLPKPLPPGFFHRKGRLYSEVSGYFNKNRWLEEYGLFLAWQSLKDQADKVLVWFGTDLKTDEQGQDEADVILVRGPKTLVIEAKARNAGEGAGADLHKRIRKTQRFFGSHAKVLMFHPAWKKNPPTDLKSLAGDNAYLIGSDVNAFKNAVRETLA